MTSSIYGMNAYQQAVQTYKTSDAKKVEESRTASATSQKEEIKTKTYEPISSISSLVPKASDYGLAIGDVQLSDKAKEYYEKLKSKFGNMEFILVSNDLKSQVQKNAASYGNASKQVVLIDAEKLEKMANDPSFAKKYEGIIAMAQTKLAEMKNSLVSSGASVKNFGINVDSHGNASYFATLEKSSEAQAKRIEKQREAKAEAKKAEKKKAEKEKAEERVEEARQKRHEEAEKVKEDAEVSYHFIESDSAEGLFDQVSAFSYNSAVDSVVTAEELNFGQNIDYKG